MDSGFQVLDFGFWIPYQESGPQAKIPRIPEPGYLTWGEGNEIVERGLPYIFFSFAVYQSGEPAHQLILVQHFGDRTFAPFCVSISVIAII